MDNYRDLWVSPYYVSNNYLAVIPDDVYVWTYVMAEYFASRAYKSLAYYDVSCSCLFSLKSYW